MSAQQVTLLASVQQFLDRQHGLYIDGAQQAAASEKRLTVWNPATDPLIAQTYSSAALKKRQANRQALRWRQLWLA